MIVNKSGVREITTLLLGLVVAAALIVSVARSNKVIKMETGFVEKQERIDMVDEETVSNIYYYDPGTHEIVKGEREIDGEWYYFDVDTGVMLMGFCEADINGNLYMFDKSWDEAVLSENNKLETYDGNVIEVQKRRNVFYYDNTGKKAFWERNIDGNWYMFEPETGRMIVGFYEYAEPDSLGNKKERYYDEYGHRVGGFQDIEGERYYFDYDSGNMETGFKYFEDLDRVVCFNKEGHMLFGEHVINGYRYVFDEETGDMLSKEKINTGNNKSVRLVSAQ